VRISRPAALVLTALTLTGCATGAAVGSGGTTHQGADVAESATTTLSTALSRPADTSSAVATSAAPSSPSTSAAATRTTLPATSPALSSSASRSATGVTTSAKPQKSARAAVHTSTAPAAVASTTTAAAPAVSAATAAAYVPIVAKKYGTGNATQIVTVTAPSSTSTTATLSAWKKVGAGWVRVYGPVKAWVGVDGVGKASEYTSKTPAGSFTLTKAFGRLSNPGTRLSYFKTNSRDWWVGQSGRYYNTHQRCKAGQACPWHSPSEHLYYVTPYYNYAAVIDYNTRNAPGGVKQHAGSAFFFHVHPAGTGGTGGCVAIKQGQLVKILKWLNPARHPRIIIGRS